MSAASPAKRTPLTLRTFRRVVVEVGRLLTALRPFDALLLAGRDRKSLHREVRALGTYAAALAAENWHRTESARRQCPSLERYVAANARAMTSLTLLHTICKAAGIEVRKVTSGAEFPQSLQEAIALSRAPRDMLAAQRNTELLMRRKLGESVVRSVDESGVAAAAATSFLRRVGLPSHRDGDDFKSLETALLEYAWRESSPHFHPDTWPAWLPKTRSFMNRRALRYVHLTRPYWLSEDLWQAASEMMQAEWDLAGEDGEKQPAFAVAQQMMQTRRKREALKAWISARDAPPATEAEIKDALANMDRMDIEEVSAQRVKELRARLNLSHKLVSSDDAALPCYEPVDPASAPDEALMIAEEQLSALDLLNKLSPNVRDLMLLELSGLSREQIATKTGRSQDAIKSSLHAGRCKLHALWARHHHDA